MSSDSVYSNNISAAIQVQKCTMAFVVWYLNIAYGMAFHKSQLSLFGRISFNRMEKLKEKQT